jgi:hypothetical protein
MLAAVTKDWRALAGAAEKALKASFNTGMKRLMKWGVT